MESVQVFSLEAPEYRLDAPPDAGNIGKKMDAVIRKHFSGERIAFRCIGLADHPSMTMDSLIKTIQKLGTDKYDPERKMVLHDFYTSKGIESQKSMFAMEYDFVNGAKLMEETVEDFYEGALADRGFRVKIDLILIYDMSRLECVPIEYGKGDIGRDCFIFKNPEQKQDALKGIIKVL